MDAVNIVNIALVKLGDAEQITSLTQGGKTATIANTIYHPLRRAELRRHPWNFAKKRQQLAVDPTEPLHGFSYKYSKPNDFIRLHPQADATDWTIEGDYILTDDSAPLEIIYIYDHTDVNKWDALFVQAVAQLLAIEFNQYRTNSNTKKQLLVEDYKDIVAEARRVNAIENISAELPDDDWVTVRL